MSVDQWLKWLEQLHFKAIDLGLDRVARVANRLQLTESTPFVFTVAGTNGKGSTAALLDHLLRQQDHRVGIYTSPHLLRFNERIVVDGKPCSDEELLTAFAAVEAAREEVSLTYFEFTTLAAIWIFKQYQLSAWVLEIGLGGRLDAVNLWDADIAIITSIGLDHQQWLGADRASIGLEKIGIGRKHKPLVIGDREIPPAVQEKAQTEAFQLYRLGREYDYQLQENQINISLSDQQQTRTHDTYLTPPQLHPANVATALQALKLSPFFFDYTEAGSAISNLQIPGRQQLVDHPKKMMLDVGHNPDAARWLCQRLKTMAFSRVFCVVGMLTDKNAMETLIELLSVVDIWYPVTLHVDRGQDGTQIANTLSEMGAVIRGQPDQSPAKAVEQLIPNVADDDLILIFGSFYTVAAAAESQALKTSLKV